MTRGGLVVCTYIQNIGGGVGLACPHFRPLYKKPLGFVLVEFFVDNVTLGARVDVGPGHL